MARNRARGVVLGLLLCSFVGQPTFAEDESVTEQELETTVDREARFEQLQLEMAHLETELHKMGGREQGLLGELERLGAELTLREKELESVTLRHDEVSRAVSLHDATLTDLEQAQDERRRYLAFRLREIYKAGDNDWLRRFVEGDSVEEYWKALSYASYISQRDSEVLGAFRRDALISQQELRQLRASQAELGRLKDDLERTRKQLASARRQRSGALQRLREDQSVRRTALEELRAAATRLSSVIDEMPDEVGGTGLDINKFRGLLEWPARGRVSAGFGKVVHPRFKTEVPHPGLDIDAGAGADIHSIFDGQVVYADWMRGYGLTTIVDHGEGVLSIYAHASVLTSQKGDRVGRGQSLGKVGETGSLRGPYLYFELRVGGRATDPEGWLREP